MQPRRPLSTRTACLVGAGLIAAALAATLTPRAFRHEAIASDPNALTSTVSPTYQMATGDYPEIKAVGTTRAWTIKPCVVVAESTGGMCRQENVNGTKGILLSVPGDLRLAAWVDKVRNRKVLVQAAGESDTEPAQLPEIGRAVQLTRRAGGWWLPVAGHDANAFNVLLRPVDNTGQPMGGLVYTFWFWAD